MAGAGPGKGLWAALVALLAAVSLVGAWFTVSLGNTLRRNGRWVSTKAELGMGVMGAKTFHNSRQTLAGGRLDLGRWHGFQEVLLREPLAVHELAFDYRLTPTSYLCFVYDQTEDGFSGVRLGSAPNVPSFFFQSRPDGEFTRRDEPLTPLGVEDWQHAVARFEGERMTLEVGGGRVGSFPARRATARRFGFRSGMRSVLLDDVRVTGEGGEVLLRESFFEPRALLLPLLGLFGGLAGAAWLALRAFRRLSWAAQRSGGLILALTLGTTLATAAAAFGYQRFFSRAYPSFDRDALKEGVEEEARQLGRELLAQHAGEREPGLLRLVFLGTSQTWGAGAARAEECFVAVVERRLNEAAPPGRRYQCIDAGIQGAKSPDLAGTWRESLIELAPDLLVVDLGNNDTVAADLARSLDTIALTSAERGIPVLLALEPNSTEKQPGELPMHPVLRAAAQRHRLPLVDLHAALAAQGDTGLLWWDFVHPTSYGHRLIAEALLPAIRSVLEP